MKSKRWGKRMFALLLSAVMTFGAIGMPASAENLPETNAAEESITQEMVTGTEVSGRTGLCEHHPQHDGQCGYVEALAGIECTHVHTDDCYTTEMPEDGQPPEADQPPEVELPPESEEGREEGTVSGDVIRREIARTEKPVRTAAVTQDGDKGSGEKVLNCSHVHDSQCGYAEIVEGQPCGYVCSICNPMEQDKAAVLVEEPSAYAVGDRIYFFAWVLDENGKELTGASKYEPGLIGAGGQEGQKHTSLNQSGAGILQMLQTANQTYTYFQYGQNNDYKDYTGGNLTLTEQGTILKVFLARKDGTQETRIELIKPGAAGYPVDPMNPSNNSVYKKTMIHGKISSKGKPVAQAEVSITNTEHSSLTKSTQTDSSGNYNLEIWQSWFGTADLVADKIGYKIESNHTFKAFNYWNTTSSYDFEAVSLAGDGDKVLLGGITGTAAANAISLEITAPGTQTQIIKPNSDRKYEYVMMESEYAGKTLRITPRARSFKFKPAYQDVSYDSYVGGAAVDFVSEADGAKELWVNTVDQANKSLPGVSLLIQTGDSFEYGTTNAGGQAQIFLYDAYYTGRKITVIPSKPGYQFIPSFTTLNFSDGVTEFDISFTGKSAAVSKSLEVIVNDKLGKPLSNVDVKLNTKTPVTGKTNGSGVAKFTGLTADLFTGGAASVSCTVSGETYQDKTVTFDTLGVVVLTPGEAGNNNDKTYLIQVSAKPAEGGTVTGGGEVPAGQMANVSAIANTGYEFVDWKSPLGITESNSPQFTFNPAMGGVSPILIANFKENGGAVKPDIYTVTAVPNNAAYGTVSGGGEYLNGQIVILRAKAKENCRFTGWTKAGVSVSTNAEYRFTASAPGSGDFIAVFERDAVNYKVLFQSNGGSTVAFQMVPENETIQEPKNPVKTGYQFRGWYQDEDFTQKWDFAVNTVTANMTLYAKWEAESQFYKVTVESDNEEYGTATGGGEYQEGAAVTVRAEAKEGYRFTGWMRNGKEIVSTDAVYSFIAPAQGEIKLTALFVSDETKNCTITFQTNGGSAIQPQTAAVGSKVKQPADPAKNGFRFQGWYSDEGLSRMWNFASDITTGDMTLYAKWVEDTIYTLIVEANDDSYGTVTGGGEYPKGAEVKIRAQHNPGYRFTGWMDSNGNMVSADEEYTVIIKEDKIKTIKLTAIFVSESTEDYDIIFQTNGGSEINNQRISEGGKVMKPRDPVREGYAFINWYQDEALNQRWDFSSDTVMGDMTLYAKWGYKFDGDITVDEIPRLTYTGTALKPVINAWDGDALLVLGKDYTVSYSNNTKATDVAVATVKGKGNYSNKGATKVNFVIDPYHLEGEDIAVSGKQYYAASPTKVTKPEIKVIFGKKTLSSKNDYTVTYYKGNQLTENQQPSEVKEPGTYTAVIEGKGNFAGMIKREIYLSDSSLILMDKASVKLKKSEEDKAVTGKYPWTGLQVTPQIESVKIGRTELIPDTDYTVSYGSNVEVGTGSVILRAKEGGTYAGEKTVHFQIIGQSISKAKPAAGSFLKSVVYTGEPIHQDQVKLEMKTGSGANAVVTELVKGKDYKVSYLNNANTNPGKVTMVFTGINSYSGTLKQTFTIAKPNLGGAQAGQFTATSESAATGVEQDRAGAVLQDLVVKYTPKNQVTGAALPERTLELGKDYTVSYQNNKNKTTETKKATVSITGKGNYSGRMKEKLEFSILSKDLASGDITVVVKDMLYSKSKKEYKPAVAVYDSGKKLANNADVKISWQDNTELTEAAVVTIEAGTKGDYTGTREQKFRIYEKDIKSAVVVLAEDQKKPYFNGQQQKPEVIKVTVKNLELTKEQYLVSYGPNTNKGTGTVTVTGLGEYGGSKTVKFSILPKWLQALTQKS